jgi:hypothetical protein
MTCRNSRFQDGGFLNNYITVFLVEGIWKVHIFRHLFACFQTSVYTLGEFHKNRNNSTVFEELEVSNPFTSPVKQHLRPSILQLTPPTLQIQYCYSLILVSKRKVKAWTLKISLLTVVTVPKSNWKMEETGKIRHDIFFIMSLQFCGLFMTITK